MPPIRNTSFIPRKTDAQNVPPVTPSDPFLTLGIIFLCVSIFLSIASFGANYYVEKQNAKLLTDISGVQNSLASVPLDEMISFYYKTKSINSVLAEHVYPTSLFALVEDAVEKEVYFTSFDFSFSGQDGYKLSLVGIAPDTRSVIRQVDTLNDPKYSKVFNVVKVNSVVADKLGNSVFDISIDINPTINLAELGLGNNTTTQTPSDISSSSTLIKQEI